MYLSISNLKFCMKLLISETIIILLYIISKYDKNIYVIMYIFFNYYLYTYTMRGRVVHGYA